MIHVGDIINVDVYLLEVIPLPEDFLSDVQTDVHFVPIDTEGRKHNLLIRLT